MINIPPGGSTPCMARYLAMVARLRALRGQIEVTADIVAAEDALLAELDSVWYAMSAEEKHAVGRRLNDGAA